jgi:hypothetical protein
MPTMRKGFAQLGAANWPSLQTAHGTAEHVPVALRALADARDAGQLFDAYWKLDNYIVHQGSLYESAYFAAPYILDILFSSRWPPLRVAAYDLLIEIARGVPDPRRPWTPVPGASEDLREACREVVTSGLKMYEPDLTFDDAGVRRRALDLLTSFDDHPQGRLKTLLEGIDPGEDTEFAQLLERAKSEL